MDAAILSRGREVNYFQTLSTTYPSLEVIAYALSTIAPKRSERLGNCGRTPVHGHLPIEMVQSVNGRVYARNVRWCGSRFCPICGPRILQQRGHKWARQAGAAELAGVCGYFLSLTAVAVEPGELGFQLNHLRDVLVRSYPSPSRWRTAPPGYLGYSWGLEPDFVLPNEQWNPHYHTQFFFREELPADEVQRLVDQWPYQAHSGASQSMEAVARYSAKGEPPKNKTHNLGLFQLAATGRTAAVEEYLLAMLLPKRRTLAQPSRALSLLLDDVPDVGGDDAALLAAADAPHAGDAVLRSLTLREWRALW